MSNSAPSNYGSLPGPRRSSYASIVSGAVNNSSDRVARSGFLAQPASAYASVNQTSHGQQFSRPPTWTHEQASRWSSTESAFQDRPQSASYGTAHPGQTDIMGFVSLDPRAPDVFIPSYLRGSRYSQRAEEKYKARFNTQRDNKNTRSSGSGTLSASTSSVNLHKMIPSHRGMTHEIIERPFQYGEDKLGPLPTRWSSTDKFSGLDLSLDGTEIKFAGPTKSHPPQDEAAAIRADNPMPRDCGVFYYEVTIMGKGKEAQIGIGFCAARVALNRLPGWEADSWAYHGDDGHSFSQTAASPKAYAQKFGFSDVIGCGVDFTTRSAFYTKNGHYLGKAFKDLDVEKPLYPSIGMKKPGEHVKTNFGQQAFVFDIDGYVTRIKVRTQNEIEHENSASLHESRHEETHLQQLVAQYLAHDGYIETAKAFSSEVHQSASLLHDTSGETGEHDYKEDLDAINRQRIRTAVLEGDVDRALKLMNAFYPTVLQEHENIYFQLRCRKFIELIRKSTELQSVAAKIKDRRDNPGSKDLTNSRMRSFDSNMDVDEPPVGRESAVAPEDDMDIEDADIYSKQNELMNRALQCGQDLQAEFKDDPRREVKQALEDTFALIAYRDARESPLASLLELDGRLPVAEELNRAILSSLGKASSAVLERLCQETEVLLSDMAEIGDPAAFVDVRGDYLR